MVNNKMHDIGWAAGFFEGEGYIGFVHQVNQLNKKDYPRLVLSISQVYREPLDKFLEIFKLGTVRGPYGPYSTTKQSYYQYMTSGEKAVEIINKLLPYLFRKGEQAEEALLKYKEYNNEKL